MSYQHITLKKKQQSDNIIIYEIFSPDFNDGELESLGDIEIDNKSRSYRHIDDQRWLSHKIYPIHIFDLSLSEREKITRNQYADFAGGAWAFKINQFIRESMQNGIFPDEKTIIA